MNGHDPPSRTSPDCSNGAQSNPSERNAASASRILKWSEEEDTTLLTAYQNSRKDVDFHGIDLEDDAVWENVARMMPSRSAVQCLLRYMKLNSNAAKGISKIDCAAASDSKRDHDDFKSPSSASTSSGSSRKKSKHDDSADDWSDEETDRLAEVMLQYQDGITTPDWDAIAKHFPGKSPIDCLTQWTNISLPDQVKGKGSWTPTEDAILREKRSEYGRKWSKIAEFLPGRSGKQCRERYINHLNPNLKRGEWTDDEEAVLIAMHEHIGNKWTLISKQLPGRSDNDVKNHYHSTIRRKFDLHGKQKLIDAAILHVFMLVDAGRLERNVVSNWKESHGRITEHSANTIPKSTIGGGIHHAPPLAELYHAIPYPPAVAAGVPFHHMHDSLYCTHPPPPPGAYPVPMPPMPHGHLPAELMMPPPGYHANHADKNNMATDHPDFGDHNT